MATSRPQASWEAVLLAAYLLLLVSPADGRSHRIRPHGHHGRQRRHHHRQSLQNVALGLNPDSYQGSGSWSPWTPSSACSRTCGGGVAYQTRVCEEIRADGSQGCVGPSKRYFSCNVEDCPDISKDFREEQCARFNSVPYMGRYYSWVPYYKAASPCELNCKPRSERFFYQHSPKTIDGTRCSDDGSLDVCINGTCVPVGCDKMLGSDAVEDKCRVCRGDGSSCNTNEGVFDPGDLKIGYNDILRIPTGATNIKIEEKLPTNNYLAVRNNTGHYYLNGNRRIWHSGSKHLAGTIFHYDRRSDNARESLVALGPTTETILIVLMVQEKNQGIVYEYSVPANAAYPLQDSYNWNAGDFGPCTQICDGGVQSRLVYCASSTTFDGVSDDLCNATIKPEATKVCNSKPCSATWFVGEWEECSKTCGKGIQSRVVLCLQKTQIGSVLSEDSHCLDSVGQKPERRRECSSNAECPSWVVGTWSECDRLCGLGTQIRVVQCINPLSGNVLGKDVLIGTGCDEVTKPSTNQTCEQRPCGGLEWVTTPLSGCQAPCSSPIETRHVFCVNDQGTSLPDEYCDYEKRPNTTKPCDDNALGTECHYMWYSSDWSLCSTECGRGLQTREVFCATIIDGSIKSTSDGNCDPAEELGSIRECVVEEFCNGTWIAAPWNRCSAPCGGGHRTRTVICLLNGKPAAPKNCDMGKKPFESESCNLYACYGDGEIFEAACKKSKHGCCPDGMTPSGANFEGCPKVARVEGGCNATKFGCCLDGVTPAFGPFMLGCKTFCNSTQFGCCPDGETAAKGSDHEGCFPATAEATPGECNVTEWGCCPDGITTATGEAFEGCNTNCTNTTFGCCPDGLQAANGENFAGCAVACEGAPFGCCPDGLAAASGTGFEGCDNCSESLYGCCTDNTSFALGPEGEGCCLYTEFGCCQDNKTEARGPDLAGCSCHTTPHGCCLDEIAVAHGPRYIGCTCQNYKYGCCPDRHTPASGPNFDGCTCSGLPYGCCLDGFTPAEGPNMEGCPCSIMEYGCCLDQRTPARGPNLAGCGCETTPYKCCPDQQTPARGSGFDGCPCTTMPYGCCADRHTAAEGPDGRGCECAKLLYGFVPSSRTPPIGPNLTGCIFHVFLRSCCPDGRTPARGPDTDGCTCAQTAFGCCHDGVTAAKRHHFEGCPDKKVIGPTRTVSTTVCGLRKDIGPCRNYKVSWFFSVSDGRCTRFWYGGCKGNENRFNSEEECEKTCVRSERRDRSICGLPQDAGTCVNFQERWYYNADDGRCHPFYYGGWDGNKNNFASHLKCERACGRQAVTDAPNEEFIQDRSICGLPQDAGTCVNLRERWYYNADDGRCHPFYYGGSDGNENNFASHLKCEHACVRQAVTDANKEEFIQESCFMRYEAGPCINLEVRWFYDKQDGVCREFSYGGCLGNGNRFRSRRDCEEMCFSAQDICTLPKVQGPCSGSFEQWFYDPEKDRCDLFIYGGCQGNANRFNTRDYCEERCHMVT
ncbi:papilin-like [Amblyomma americanum]